MLWLLLKKHGWLARKDLVDKLRRANPMNTASVTATEEKVNFGDTQGLQILCTILFMKEEKYIELKKKQWNLCPL